MKFKITLIALLLSISLYTKAQNYVTIPDAHFAAWLNTYYPTCMNGNQMDTTCPDIINAVVMEVGFDSIADLTGVEYFVNLQRLNCLDDYLISLPVLPNSIEVIFCSGNLLTSLPTLPNSLQYIECNQNQLTSFPALPNSLKYIDCSSNQLTSLPALNDSLQTLGCGINQITSLPSLPNSLKHLGCHDNQILSLPSLPDSLESLSCSKNLLTNIPTLPNSLNLFDCSYNQLTSLPALPSSINILYCNNNQLTSLPALPDSMYYLYCNNNELTSLPTLPHYLGGDLACYNNQLASLPALPNSMENLWCFNNLLTSIPTLPNNLKIFNCSYNQLTSIPALPNTIQRLACNNNQLTSLPTLPNSLFDLNCSHNQLTSLPPLQSSLKALNCSNNNIFCFAVFNNSFYNGEFDIDSNSFSCLPNYISAMNSATLAYPLCVQGDSINNPNGCIEANYISGYIYKDSNANCVKDIGDLGLANIPIKLYDNNNNLIAQINSFTGGDYNFVQPIGIYTVVIDTANMPFTAQCIHPGIDSVVTTTILNPMVNEVNFAIACKSGFDVGVQSVVTTGWVFPGQHHVLRIVAGSMEQWYNLNCGAGVSGQVLVTVSGPVTYLGPAIGALTPLVSGNEFTYSIADFSNVNNTHDFGLNFITNTSAQAGDLICVNVNVTPTSGDFNVSNNTYQYCYSVLNSYDPNMKEVYPVNVLSGYNDYFTYTIHFQNTGTAPAFNIKLVDTLSPDLDLETFKVINYSHNNIASLTGNVLTLNFPNIMLPDSASDESGSKGFVQYKIKPKANLALGTQIENTAYIYFDYNAPVVTNTIINEYVEMTSINEQNASTQISVYPNPVLDYATLIFTTTKAQQIQIKVIDLLGQELIQSNKQVNSGTNNIQINTQTLAKGFYVLSVKDGGNEVRTVRFVK